MCFNTPDVPEAQQYQVAQDPTFSDGTEDEATKRGRRGTILARAPQGAVPQMAAQSGQTGKTMLGQ